MSTQSMSVVMLLVGVIQPDPQNPRKVKDDENLRDLALDIKRRGVLVPLIVRKNSDVHVLIDGHRRHAAARMAGLAQVPCVVFGKEVTEAEIREAQLVTQLHSQALTGFEVYTGSKNWMALHPQATAKDLAAAISRSEGYVSMVLSLDKCIPAVKEAAALGKLGLKDWYAISQVACEQQEVMLLAKLNGASAEGLKRMRKKPENAVRTAKVKCLMGSGVCVMLTGVGQGLTLDDVIETLSELLKEAKRANDQGLDSSTFQAVMRDKSKAG